MTPDVVRHLLAECRDESGENGGAFTWRLVLRGGSEVELAVEGLFPTVNPGAIRGRVIRSNPAWAASEGASVLVAIGHVALIEPIHQ